MGIVLCPDKQASFDTRPEQIRIATGNPFEEAHFLMLGELSGTTYVHDSSLYHTNNYGLLSVGADDNVEDKWIIENGRYTLNFDGVNDWVNCGSAYRAGLTMWNWAYLSWSVSAWIRADAFGYYDEIVGDYSSGGDGGWGIDLLQDGYVGFWLNHWAGNSGYAGGPATRLTAPITTGKWTHVCGVSDKAGARLYVDGALKASDTTILVHVWGWALSRCWITQ
jgi:hypothetical protein